ncbi:hypothetical protein D3C81_606490 [compost metagenome]
MKDKFTAKEAIREVQHAYDHFEKVAKDVLREEFGFGDKRIARFEEKFSELAANECLRIEASMRRRLKK